MQVATTLGFVALVSAALGTTTAAPPGSAKPPAAAETLFWSEAQKIAGFPHMEDQFSTHTAHSGSHIHPLPAGTPISFTVPVAGRSLTLDQFMSDQQTAGLLVIQNGRIRLEKYALGLEPAGRWTSFSVAKSFTSTLVGAAVKDGYIRSINDPIVRYIPALKGSAYDGVTIRQVLTMTSGVKWNEDYADPKSDVAKLFSVTPDSGMDSTVSYMHKLPREAPPGTKWVYKTGETNLIGVLVTAATHKTLADYLSEKIWKPYGMQESAFWITDERGQETGGCCLSMALRDYGRMGTFMLGGAKAGGKPVLPEGWIAAATHREANTGQPGRGYGYQWWTEDDGSYNAYGIFGQLIHIDPKRQLVIVISSAWPTAVGRETEAAQEDLIDAAKQAVDADQAH